MRRPRLPEPFVFFVDALGRNHVAVFTVGEANGAEHARRFVEALDTIRRFARSAKLPFVAAVNERLELVVRHEDGERLAKARTVKGKRRP